MEYKEEFKGQPHRRHDPLGPPSVIVLTGATAALGVVGFVIMIVGMTSGVFGT